MKELFEIISVTIEAAAVVLLSIGLIISTGRFVYGAARGMLVTAYRTYRQELGRTLMLSLELLIAADIIYSIAIENTIASLGMLAILVLIRTFLSLSIELEVSGRWPWQGGDGATVDE